LANATEREGDFVMYANKTIKVAALTILVSSVGLFTLAAPSMAQGRINKNALEKATFYQSPREVQIIDDRPVVRDFREAPSAPQSIDLPPGPQGFGGGSGGGGAGALGGGPGSSIPAGGMPLGGNQGYRSAPGGGLALPKSGFGRDTNIPARGMGHGGLPDGSSTNRMMGKMLNSGVGHGSGAGAPRGMQPSAGKTNGNYNGPAVESYSGGYGSGSGSGYGGSASRTDTSVRGSLLKHN
jgi:hypothetical protein